MTKASYFSIKLSKKHRYLIYILLFLFLIALQSFYTLSLSQNSLCFLCHQIRPYVKAHSFSPHYSFNCGTCHPGPGLTNYLSGEIIAFRNFLSFLAAGNVDRNSFFPPSTCVNCHQDVFAETLKGKVRVRHKDFLQDYVDCLRCHGGVAHKTAGYVYNKPLMLDCLECHNDQQASADCGTCHPGRKKALLAVNLEAYGKFHPDNYLNIHGAEKSDKCLICHQENFCSTCHIMVKTFNIELPHPESWIYTHWQATGKENVGACYACHDQKKCDACHGLRMPHPDGFLKVHASNANRYGTDKCLKCHDSRSCSNCHIKHIHSNFGTFWTPGKVFQRYKSK
jgi:nitrate/TMAO reductase-like tetraheme cytochrome c subunit